MQHAKQLKRSESEGLLGERLCRFPWSFALSDFVELIVCSPLDTLVQKYVSLHSRRTFGTCNKTHCNEKKLCSVERLLESVEVKRGNKAEVNECCKVMLSTRLSEVELLQEGTKEELVRDSRSRRLETLQLT